ncbi:hypothetical protein F1559_003466 [Cyanidiococcus yangmingshanensis]|uniref:Uncharacterized protein n=1 Tax=Cyanidiococcus yangmingshanensis TaxID=2690220 RepID=A0A7J7IN14_9RHOD|nr:hypothetical protein F1559_003466 [Cyanidiococcus yangmingshanensis]
MTHAGRDRDWLKPALPVGVALCGRPLLDGERLSRSALFLGSEDAVYTCDGDSSSVMDHLSGYRIEFDGAFVLGYQDSPSQLYFDAAFRSSITSPHKAEGAAHNSVWSIQDAILAAIEGLTDVCIFTYGGNGTGKTYLLRRLMLLAAQDIQRQALSSQAVISLHATDYSYEDEDIEVARSFYASDCVEADQLPSLLWSEFRRREQYEAAGNSSHQVWRLVLESGTRITFADTQGASRIVPDGGVCRPDLTIFSFEQAVMHAVEHAECTEFTRSIAAGLGGNAIGIALCCFGQTAFHRFHENARTFGIAQGLMRLINRIPVEPPLERKQVAMEGCSATESPQNISLLAELSALQQKAIQDRSSQGMSQPSITFYD